MKKIFNICTALLSLTLLLGLGACQKDKNEPAEESFKVLASEISQSKEASVGTIQLSEGGFKFEVSAPWVTLSLKEATKLELNISENTSGEMRSCLVSLTKGTTRINVPVHQMGRIALVEGLADFSLALMGGEQSFVVQSEDPVLVHYEADWLSYKLEGGKLIFTAPQSNVASRSAKVQVKSGLFAREITVTQKISVDDLLGDYTLSYLSWSGQPRVEVDARLVKVANGYELHGVAAPVPVSINPTTFAIRPLYGKLKNTPQVPAGEQLMLAAWAGAYPKADGNPNYDFWTEGEEVEYIGVWDKNTTTPKFTFKSAKAQGQARAFILFRGPGFKGWYEGGNKINSIVDPILTKKAK